MTELSHSTFYDDLPLIDSFSAPAPTDIYTKIPDDWLLGMTDVVGSTKAIAEGKYKTVNMVGAAVISAIINTLQETAFPFVFGGDGATFAIPPQFQSRVEQQMSAVRQWADNEFGLELRASIIPLHTIREAGHSIGLARFAASPAVDYAMFRGSGITWAEKQLKSGAREVPQGDPSILPDLTGLSCRWAAMESRNGSIVSLVVVPAHENAMEQFDTLAEKLNSILSASEGGGRPVPSEGPGVAWPPEGLALEAHASHGKKSLFITKIKLLLETLIAWIFFKTKIKAGEFDPIHYQQTAGLNADFRKFEEGLKMTVDCNDEVKQQLVSALEDARSKGYVRYGIHEQSACMMTCIVPSIMSDDHVHFIDGANGGYTAAASNLKMR